MAKVQLLHPNCPLFARKFPNGTAEAALSAVLQMLTDDAATIHTHRSRHVRDPSGHHRARGTGGPSSSRISVTSRSEPTAGVDRSPHVRRPVPSRSQP